MLPIVSKMEDSLFYPAEHSKRTAGLKALGGTKAKPSLQNEPDHRNKRSDNVSVDLQHRKERNTAN